MNVSSSHSHLNKSALSSSLLTCCDRQCSMMYAVWYRWEHWNSWWYIARKNVSSSGNEPDGHCRTIRRAPPTGRAPERDCTWGVRRWSTWATGLAMAVRERPTPAIAPDTGGTARSSYSALKKYTIIKWDASNWNVRQIAVILYYWNAYRY